MISALRTGESRALVVRGGPGVGKSALLGYAENAAAGVRVLRAVGVESEMELAYAALHQLCAPVFDRLTEIPGPQRAALETVFGRRTGLPGRPGGVEPAVEHIGTIPAALRDRRRAMARQSLGPGTGLRRPPATRRVGVTFANWATTILNIGLARYEQAMPAAQVCTQIPELWVSVWALPELVEAATRLGQEGIAHEALERLIEATDPCDSDWAQGIEARSKALVVDGPEADDLYRLAVERLSRTQVRPELTPRAPAVRRVDAPR